MIHQHRRTLPRVCGPTEHLTAVFEDVLVAVGVLDSVLSRPGTFNLSKTTTKNNDCGLKINPDLMSLLSSIQKQTSNFRCYSHRTAVTD